MDARYEWLTVLLFTLVLAGCSPGPTATSVSDSSLNDGNISYAIVTNGMPQEAFLNIIGKPKGQMSSGSKEWMLYDDFQVSVDNGLVYDIPEKLKKRYARKAGPSTLDRIKETKIAIPAPKELKAVMAKRKAYTVLDSQGQPVDHSGLVTSGKVTVVEFYVEGSASCTIVEEELKKMVKEYEAIAFRTVDIKGWNSDTSKQYHIGSIPDIRILDTYGNLVTQPVTRLEEVDGRIDLSRVREAIEKAL